MSETVSYIAALPEIVLAVGAMAVLMIGSFTGANGERAGWLSILVLIVAGALILTQTGVERIFNDAFVSDPYARFVKILILAGSAAAILLSIDDLRRASVDLFEVSVLILLATVGMMMMVSAGDLLALYLGLELQSLALYVLAAVRRDDVRSSEAGMKYFVLGALSSGMLLYGASLLYGFTGTTSFAGIEAAVSAPGAVTNIGLIAGLVFLLVGLAFKISAVPFHMWTPDVYEGAPTPVTAFFAAAPKLAALALFARVLFDGFGGLFIQWQKIVIFLALASMLLGAFAAIGQTNIKRLMAYSGIGNIGYALVGLAAGTASGVRGVLVYMAIYVVMTLGTFACILAMRRQGRYVEQISDLSGLSRRQPLLAAALSIFMFSLAGIPPLAGFFGKLYVFLAAVEANLTWLAIVGVLTSVVGAYYYLRIVKLVYFDEPAEAFDREGHRQVGVVTAVAAVAILLFVIFPAPLLRFAEVAAAAVVH